jgi:hypothetical protein
MKVWVTEYGEYEDSYLGDAFTTEGDAVAFLEARGYVKVETDPWWWEKTSLYSDGKSYAQLHELEVLK